MPSKEYTDRYCAFVDILGFRGLINELRLGSLSVETLHKLLTTIHQPTGISTECWPTDFRAQSISDAVAISANANKQGLIEILRALENLTIPLLAEGYFVRGGLVKGPLYHDANIVFGDALIDAYRIESQIARFPRVMVTRPVWSDFERYKEEEDGWDGQIMQSDDGPMFVHTLRSISEFAYRTKLRNINLSPPERDNLDHISAIQQMIQRRLDEAIDVPNHFEKIRWFADYWNKSVPYGGSDFTTIQGPGLNVLTLVNSKPTNSG